MVVDDKKGTPCRLLPEQPEHLRQVKEEWIFNQLQEPLLVFNADGSYGEFTALEDLTDAQRANLPPEAAAVEEDFMQEIFQTQDARLARETVILNENLVARVRVIGHGKDAITHEFVYRQVEVEVDGEKEKIEGRWQGRPLLEQVVDITDRNNPEVIQLLLKLKSDLYGMLDG